jgi:nicotinamidase-related amidase
MPDPLKLDLADTTLVCIDIQQRPRTYWTPRRVKETFREGEAFTLDELNAAVDHFFEVLLPHAAGVAEFALRHGLPRVFVHWSSVQGVDQPRPNEIFRLQVGDYVIAKTQRDAFASSNLAGVLAGLGRRTLLLMGGHTRGCLGDTARTALTAGYRCVLVRDATYDVSILRWPLGIAEAPYTAVIDTAELLAAGE